MFIFENDVPCDLITEVIKFHCYWRYPTLPASSSGCSSAVRYWILSEGAEAEGWKFDEKVPVQVQGWTHYALCYICIRPSVPCMENTDAEVMSGWLGFINWSRENCSNKEIYLQYKIFIFHFLLFSLAWELQVCRFLYVQNTTKTECTGSNLIKWINNFPPKI